MSSDESQRAALLALLGRKLAGEQAAKTVLFQQAVPFIPSIVSRSLEDRDEVSSLA